MFVRDIFCPRPPCAAVGPYAAAPRQLENRICSALRPFFAALTAVSGLAYLVTEAPLSGFALGSFFAWGALWLISSFPLNGFGDTARRTNRSAGSAFQALPQNTEVRELVREVHHHHDTRSSSGARPSFQGNVLTAPPPPRHAPAALTTSIDPTERGKLGNNGERSSARRSPPLVSSEPPAYHSQSGAVFSAFPGSSAIDSTVRGTVGDEGVRSAPRRSSSPISSGSSAPVFTAAPLPQQPPRIAAATFQSIAMQSQERGTVGNNGERNANRKRNAEVLSSPPPAVLAAPTPIRASSGSPHSSSTPAALVVMNNTALQERGTVGRREQEKAKLEEERRQQAIASGDPTVRGRAPGSRNAKK